MDVTLFAASKVRTSCSDFEKIGLERTMSSARYRESETLYLVPQWLYRPFVDFVFPVDDLANRGDDAVFVMAFVAHLRHFHFSGFRVFIMEPPSNMLHRSFDDAESVLKIWRAHRFRQIRSAEISSRSPVTIEGETSSCVTLAEAKSRIQSRYHEIRRDMKRQAQMLNSCCNSLEGFGPRLSVNVIRHLLRLREDGEKYRRDLDLGQGQSVDVCAIRKKYSDIESMLGEVVDLMDDGSLCLDVLSNRDEALVHVNYDEHHAVYIASRRHGGDEYDVALANFGDGSDRHRCFSETDVTLVMIKVQRFTRARLEPLAKAVDLEDIDELYALFPDSEEDRVRLESIGRCNFDYAPMQVMGNCTTYSLLRALCWLQQWTEAQYVGFTADLLGTLDVVCHDDDVERLRTPL